MIIRFWIVVHVCSAFQLKCPCPAQWSLRARSHCPDPSKYFCLKDDLINGYSENCTVSDFLQPGRKHVLRGGLDADICSRARYQPWPITFYTNATSQCIFLKTACSEEGQVVNDNGNKNTDTTCKCDYSKGYDFLVKPRNPCFCVPSEEDCSCYLKICPHSTLNLSPDYACISSRQNISTSTCGSIMNGRENKDESKRNLQNILKKDNISNTVQWKRYAGIIGFVLCIGLVFVFCGNELADKYYRKAYFISKPPNDITIAEGQSLSMEYKLLLNRFAVDFRKNNVSIKETGHIYKIDTGCSKTLIIKNINKDDEGKYSLETAVIKSKAANACNVIVKLLFIRPLQDIKCVEGSHAEFECKTEKGNGGVVWFKDGVKITDDTDKFETEKIETEQGYIYKLKIKYANLKDSGNYRIVKNGFQKEATLDVQVLFIRPLLDIKCIEGSHIVFECETGNVYGDVDWFKDGIKLAVNSTKTKTFTGFFHCLEIRDAVFKDSGRYRIEINRIRSEAELEVKGKVEVC